MSFLAYDVTIQYGRGDQGSDIHCKYWKSIVYVTCIIDF